jgi:uncharacterized membrane protein YphA (DoxX/SURF4 family)
MKIIGMILIAIGLIDLIGSYTGFDLWGGFLGVQLPDFLWKISSYIEIGVGYLLFTLGSKDAEADTE